MGYKSMSLETTYQHLTFDTNSVNVEDWANTVLLEISNLIEEYDEGGGNTRDLVRTLDAIKDTLRTPAW
jgi:hypothetical protein